jgi:hypothetical protein
MKRYRVTLTAEERRGFQELIASGKAAAKKPELAELPADVFARLRGAPPGRRGGRVPLGESGRPVPPEAPTMDADRNLLRGLLAVWTVWSTRTSSRNLRQTTRGRQ